MITKILIANRGEIAVRIIRTCREMGIKTVAVYSTVDRKSPHVLLADEAYCIGAPESIKSYLNIKKILDVIKKSKANAVHPGYGFLSENSEFANLLKLEGIIWIGPSADTINKMGDKVKAREIAQKLSISIIPGTEKPITIKDDIENLANNIGYPILVKAACGGGGKGMRIIYSSDKLIEAIDRATSEAKMSFSDSRVYLEKYLEDPHHIEVQILSDTHGNFVCLGERECSIQRRYQKIIEETPSPFIDQTIRKELLEASIKLAKACNYIGAGTVEFLVDKHKNWYFLEMNTRLQVEHPITEMVNGIDIVKEQINIADGQYISINEEQISPRGHSIECRIYAEDGLNKFQPSIGKITDYYPPSGPGIRLDEGFIRGLEITPYYDPILGKLIVWAPSRKEAILRMGRALKEIKIIGLITTISICKEIINHKSFIKGDYCTHTLDQILPEIIKNKSYDIKNHYISLIIDQYNKNLGKLVTEEPISEWVKSNRDEDLE